MDLAKRARYKVTIDTAIARAVGMDSTVMLLDPSDGAHVVAKPTGQGSVRWQVTALDGAVLVSGRRLFDGSDIDA